MESRYERRVYDRAMKHGFFPRVADCQRAAAIWQEAEEHGLSAWLREERGISMLRGITWKPMREMIHYRYSWY